MAVVRASVVLLLLVTFVRPSEAAGLPTPALVPAPRALTAVPCAGGGLVLRRPLRFATSVDPGGFALVRERWQALGIPPPVRAAPAEVTIAQLTERTPRYTLRVGPDGVVARGSTPELRFDALATLAQLPVRGPRGWTLPCVAIDDRPALGWRIVSDDISRGPFPTPRYFEERIRTLASLKINGWSPYMEGVFADPRHPYVATPNALDAALLRHLTAYARRFHVALIPQQQTLAHMHGALAYDALADAAELPHGYLLSPGAPATYAYLDPILRAERAATGTPPFFGLGADEPLDLGRGRTPRTAEVFAAHVARVARDVAVGGTRPLIWDDAIQADPSILRLLPAGTVVATFHYGVQPSFAKEIATVARGGVEQLVAPGASDWNEIYADLDTAYANTARFVADAAAARVLGMFFTVWHDDGESLYEATWSPVAFAAASAWQTAPVARAHWHATFARTFFGSDDPRLGRALDALAAIRDALRGTPDDPSNYIFWSDPFDARIAARYAAPTLAQVRVRAETVLTDAAAWRVPLHANAAAVIALAARRYDDLGRRRQIGVEARAAYDDARAHLAQHDDARVYRDLNLAKYACWELRDELTDLEPQYARAWRYESTPAGLARVLVRYREGAAAALRAADRLNAATREDALRAGNLPPFDDVLSGRP